MNIARERTEAFGATFMGLTVGCAVCHDHKYDPTTQKDFYALSAFFNNIQELPFNKDRPVWEPVARLPRAENEAAYDRVLAQRSALASRLDEEHSVQRKLVEQWLRSHQDAPRPVSSDGLVLRLRLDEGGGEVLKNSAPLAQPVSFPIGKAKPQWGETTWLWPDFRMDTSTRVNLGKTGDYESTEAFSTGGWVMLRNAPNFSSDSNSGALISRMDTTQHYRGWDLAIEKGVLSVDLVSQASKGALAALPRKEKENGKEAEAFEYPTPADLSAKDLAPNRVVARKKIEKRDDAKEKKEESAKAAEARKHTKPEAKDTTPAVGIRVAALQPLPLDGKWKHVFFTYDGSGRAVGVHLFVDGRPVATRVVLDKLERATMRTAAPMQLGWRYPDATPVRDTRYQDIRLYHRALAADEVSRLPFEDYVAEVTARPASQWNADEWHAVVEFYFNAVDRQARALRNQIATLDAQLEKLSRGGPLTLVSWERPSLAYADVLTRGVYTARVERVQAETPHYLPRLPAGQPRNRLALAKWTVSPENPLTARVTVNRMWAELFGTGLVETTEDFGIMGQRPSNPLLLDWLATEFRQSGWDMKHMYKLMVMSATYRQSARSTPAQLARDPRNQYLSHGPRFRMDAEMLRDIALQSGGLLVSRIGGPSVKPYQPANVWEQVSYPTSDTVTYVQQHQDALYRRSMYTYWKRMATLPNMDAFDAPMRDTVCTRRQRTDTPLQALVTMNDVQWTEAARALAQRVIEEGGPQPEGRIRMLSEILLARDPSPQTTAVLEGSLAKMKAHYASDPGAARRLVESGERKRNASIPAAELASWTMVASEMLNLDETLNK